MKSAEIREAFLKFFADNGHTVVDSSSLVPGNDPTLLFTNAGMVQFKDVFLGSDKRSYSRAVSSQRCVRAGGKHNDLENVGYTARHHTFFEMLGNFSFGDYFKRDAIRLAWEFLTKTLGLPAERLWVTVHISDDEAEAIWLNEVGISPTRFSKLDEDNFWQMGDTGPCGPSSEIFYDHGADIAGGPPGSEGDNLDRYIEIWNLVFMQFERSADGKLTPLPNPSIDTGMGLERIAAVMQSVHSNYEIDLFQNLLRAASDITGERDLENKSLRVIADHIRSCSFLVVDGVIPANEGRGYVLRRIIRRAIRHGHKLGTTEPFFYKLVSALANEMGGAYPELKKNRAQIEKILLMEEEQFAKTLDNGMRILEECLASLNSTTIPGEVVFKLYDTYGFPLDLTNDIAREKGLSLDIAGYDTCMEEAQKRSREGGKFNMDYTKTIKVEGETEFLGYQTCKEMAHIVAIIKGDQNTRSLAEGEEGVIVHDKTPFYAESGGQIGDTGFLTQGANRFEVRDTQKSGSNHLHYGVVISGTITVDSSVEANVDKTVRQATMLNHSATHLLHAALREVLGTHVAQKGSLVNAKYLRFDFSHSTAITAEQLKKIEHRVNEQIRYNSEVNTQVTDIETAKAKGAMALFGEKYGDVVRVLSMGEENFSVELCGGTHVKRTGDIGLMRIVSESGIAAGVRRIEGVTGEAALQYIDQMDSALQHVVELVKASRDNVTEKVQQLLGNHKKLEKELAQIKGKLASSAGADLISQAKKIGDVNVLAVSLDIDPKELRNTMDQLKNKLGRAVILLACVEGDKVSLVAGVTKDLTNTVKAGDLMKEVAAMVGGQGGGRPDMAQGGGTDTSAVPRALESVLPWVEAKLAS